MFTEKFGPKDPIYLPWSKIQRWSLFFIASVAMLGVCFVGGRWGHIGSHPLVFGGIFQKSHPLVFPAGGFMLLWAATFFLGGLLFFLFPRGTSARTAATLIFLLALLFRLVLLSHPPSNDVFRYLWEGRLITKGFNPYQFAPNDPHLAHLAVLDPLHAKINHPDFTAIYPPLFLYIMALVVWIKDSILGLKILITCVDLFSVALILRLLHQRGHDLRWAIIYAFNPVSLYAFSGQGHLDVFQNSFILTAIFLYDRRCWRLMFVTLGLAVQSKYMAVLLFPFFVRKENWRYLGLMFVVVVIPFIPLINGHPYHIFSSLVTFSQNFAFNGSFHKLLQFIFGNIRLATRICQIIFGVILISSWIRLHPQKTLLFKNDPLPGCLFVISVLLLLSPTVHFWYLSWGLIFLPFRPNIAWVAPSLTIGAVFAAQGNQFLYNWFHLPAGYQMLVWVVPWSLLIRQLFRYPSRLKTARLNDLVQTVSVVVPTLNESKHIQACIARLKEDPDVLEVIVVDGGSTDHTVVDANRAGAIVRYHTHPLASGGGRGGQIAKGIDIAKGDVIAVVHADTLMVRPKFASVLALLNQDPFVIGGAMGNIFHESGWRYRLLELANDFRAVSSGISFGDQIQFFRRRPVMLDALYPNQPLMEDVELSLRLKKKGRLAYFFGSHQASSRKWRTAGFGRTWHILGLLVIYLWQRLFKKPDLVWMYQRYYKQ